MNKVTIVGTLGRDPEVKFSQEGKAICTLSVATNESVKNGDKWEKKTDWHSITLFGKRAETAGQYLSKGSKVAIEGKLQTRSWEKDGKKQYKTEVFVSEIEFLSSPKQQDTAQSDFQEYSQPQQSAPPDIDDIPF